MTPAAFSWSRTVGETGRIPAGSPTARRSIASARSIDRSITPAAKSATLRQTSARPVNPERIRTSRTSTISMPWCESIAVDEKAATEENSQPTDLDQKITGYGTWRPRNQQKGIAHQVTLCLGRPLRAAHARPLRRPFCRSRPARGCRARRRRPWQSKEQAFYSSPLSQAAIALPMSSGESSWA